MEVPRTSAAKSPTGKRGSTIRAGQLRHAIPLVPGAVSLTQNENAPNAVWIYLQPWTDRGGIRNNDRSALKGEKTNA